MLVLITFATPDPVSVWMGDRLWTGKPPWHTTRHPGLLKLSHPSMGKQMSTSNSWGSKQAHRVIH